MLVRVCSGQMQHVKLGDGIIGGGKKSWKGGRRGREGWGAGGGSRGQQKRNRVEARRRGLGEMCGRGCVEWQGKGCRAGIQVLICKIAGSRKRKGLGREGGKWDKAC